MDTKLSYLCGWIISVEITNSCHTNCLLMVELMWTKTFGLPLSLDRDFQLTPYIE